MRRPIAAHAVRKRRARSSRISSDRAARGRRCPRSVLVRGGRRRPGRLGFDLADPPGASHCFLDSTIRVRQRQKGRQGRSGATRLGTVLGAPGQRSSAGIEARPAPALTESGAGLLPRVSCASRQRALHASTRCVRKRFHKQWCVACARRSRAVVSRSGAIARDARSSDAARSVDITPARSRSHAAHAMSRSSHFCPSTCRVSCSRHAAPLAARARICSK
jgi:hypothetical protein